MISLWNQANYVDLYVIHNPRAGRIKERDGWSIDSRVVASGGVVIFMPKHAINIKYHIIQNINKLTNYNQCHQICMKVSLLSVAGRFVELICFKEVWSLLLKLREEGLCKAVGVSNFGIGQLEGVQT